LVIPIFFLIFANVKIKLNKQLTKTTKTMAKFIEHDVNLSVELYRNGEDFCAWLSDNVGGSGIEAVGETPEKLADKLSPYIADYFYEESDEEDGEEEVSLIG